MAITKASVYTGTAWETQDLGAKATNVKLTNSRLGQSTVEGVLSKFPSGRLTGKSLLTVDADGNIITTETFGNEQNHSYFVISQGDTFKPFYNVTPTRIDAIDNEITDLRNGQLTLALTDEILNTVYPIGCTYVTTTFSEGGPDIPPFFERQDWELIDQSYAYYKGTDENDTSKPFIEVVNNQVTINVRPVAQRYGHSIYLRFYFVTNNDIANNSNRVIAKINLDNIGILNDNLDDPSQQSEGLQALMPAIFGWQEKANSDSASADLNEIILLQVNTNGNIETKGVIKTSGTTIPADSPIRTIIQYEVPLESMDYTLCDKFIWKRIPRT